VEKAAPTAFVRATADSNNPEARAISGGGSEELAAARRYLKGTDGQKQDTTEAVDWLWKAVAKRNIEATLLLSDLFLKGSGVPQNCDQGRVLLDAAASRGSKDAAVRLRHLQAFGCQ
jgi:TPR repeat protein